MTSWIILYQSMPNVINPSETLEGSLTTNIIADNIGPSELNPSTSSLLEPKSSTTQTRSSTSTTTAANSEILHDQQSLDSVATDDNEDYDDDGGEVFDSLDYNNDDDDNEVFSSADYDNNDNEKDDSNKIMIGMMFFPEYTKNII